jgi:NADH dehydrogenase FAD-containing subunit
VIALADSQLPQSVSISYRRHQFARMRDSVRQRFEQMIRDKMITPYLNTQVASIASDHVTLKAHEGLVQVANDQMIVQIGGTAPASLLRSIGIELVEKRGEA